jgi:hypothetical protein
MTLKVVNQILPEYPSYVTLFRRYHEWDESGVLQQVIRFGGRAQPRG